MLGYISTVTTTDLITAAKFNEIQQQVYQIVGPGYHYAGYQSQPVTTATIVAAGNWGTLHNDVNQCIIHQTNAAITTPYPTVGQKITATMINSLIGFCNSAYLNSSTVAAGQLGNTQFNSTSTRTGIWNAPMTHHVKYQWVASPDADGFFALGGYFKSAIGAAGATGGADDTIWQNLVTAAAPNLDSAAYQLKASDWFGLASGASKTVTAASYLTESIQIVYTKTNYQTLDIYVNFVTNSLRTMQIDIFSVVSEYYSLGGVGPAPHGFAARRPDVITVLGLDGNQGFNEYVPRQIISVNPTSLTYSGYTSSTLVYQTLSISNTGNTATQVNSIASTNNGGVTLLQEPNTFPIYISSGTTATVTLSYISNNPGTFANNITIAGPFDSGNTTVPTTVTLALKPFDFTLSPNTITQTVTRNQATSYQLLIQPINGIFSTYSASITAKSGNATYTAGGVTYNAFTLRTPQPLSGPILVFDPTVFTNGTYTCTVTVTVNGVTHTASISFTRNVPSSSHLGSWLSPAGKFNSIIGMSYDIIYGQRYLTIGIGMGADGSKQLYDGGATYTNVNYLNYDGDRKYDIYADPSYQGYMKKVGGSITAWSNFLNTYGVWVDTDNTKPNGTFMTRSFKFTCPVGQNYGYQFAIDNEGWFDIDGQAVLGNQGPNVFASSTVGSVYISAGEHVITLHMKNVGTLGPSNYGGIGLNIYNGRFVSIWNTKDHAVTSNAYLYWQEVYRIPIPADGVARTFYNAPYCVKDTGAVNGTRWSDYFGTLGDASQGSMFSIADDGVGNLSINLLTSFGRPSGSEPNAQADIGTLINLQYALYYYADPNIFVRYNQLEEIQNGSQTHQLTGFDSNGNVITTLQTYPGYNNTLPSGGGGNDWISDFIVTQIVTTAVDIAIFGPIGSVIIGQSGALVATLEGELAVTTGSLILDALAVLIEVAVCFTKDTLVDMADGTRKKIIDVKEGDLVWNHNKTQVNRVTLFEYDIDETYCALYSPSDEFEPFATYNHPLIIDGEMYSPDPESNYKTYPWLGRNKKLENIKTVPASGQQVYSLWVDGDNTFRVNGYGTHSIFGEGGGLLDCYQRGYLTKDEVLRIRHKFTSYGNDAVYGGYLYNNFLSWANIKPLTNISANTFREGSNIAIEKTAMFLLAGIGKVARAWNKITKRTTWTNQ
jgi:hypothetical protein